MTLTSFYFKLDPTQRSPTVSIQPDPFFNVPEELWLEIFYCATGATCVDDGVDYVPFAAIPLEERRDSPRVERRCFATKRNLLLVCKAWNALATETVYRTIRICRGTNTLLDSLNMDTSSDKPGGGNGRFVRNVEIGSGTQDFDPFNPTIVAQILAHCPGMVSLTRPFAFDGVILAICKVRVGDGSRQSSHMQVIPHFPTLSALRRVDWWLPKTAVPSRHSDLSSTELFRDLLGDIIKHAPNLQYLTIGGPSHSYISGERYSFAPILSLHNLTTLRLECDVQFDNGRLSATTWQLPNLTHLLVGGTYFVAIPVIEACGSHLKVLEIIRKSSRRRGTLFTPAIIHHLLSRAPNLEELNFPLDGFAEDRQPVPPAYLSTLQTIRLYLGSRSPTWLSEPMFDFVKLPHCLPMLKHLVLYNHDPWQDSFQHPTFLLFKQALEERSCSIEFA
ncbi:uncharacterized protein LACBIDRAFT_326719 [Laccaria bicolor S238N-H82]|uniref:Predicted protein n=1 Tax=Laccaria bicolor (strain S238N-H82 / ATCC MYA-4686) TaxID=486041 RepID=B0D9G1_LACBS|nr:uncharacterized protein LACBIDRAFT_326719 [Laccaria bicolor S238N-H82]EDR08346.1 predicted protein [Laccaria bicolor S238N-H82]|eukprot:XP_001880571.1 predicted protein [Laccaria bicolor S238N-H82]